MTTTVCCTDYVVGARFVHGSLIGVGTWSATMLGHVLGPALLLPPLGFFVGGAVAGTALRRSVGAACGFSLAFVIGDLGGLLYLLFGSAFSYSIVFAIASMIGLSSAAVRGWPLAIGVLGFSVAGCATAIQVSQPHRRRVPGRA